MADRLSRALARLGFAAFRTGQREAVEALVAGRDVLAVMPTGAGKSAIYQAAGLLLPGPTLVVSPLIALQRDQVESIEEEGAAEAAQLNSSLGERRREAVLEELEEGGLEYLFLAPEQLANDETLAAVEAAKPSLLVVDEAHCISEWGHDFRPEYLRLGALADALGHPRILALTATASPPVRDEIVERLHMRDAELVVRGFDRPNIWLGVEEFFEAHRRDEAIVDRVASEPKPGIVYTATRARAEELAARLQAAGVRAAAYHAGLAAHARRDAQDAFMRDDAEVVVATVAFGMGIDKPNVRFVFHAEIAESVDAYYQEIGRAGRDGGPARAILFYRAEDVGLQRFLAASPRIEEEQLVVVAEAVDRHHGPVEITELRDETGLSESRLSATLGRLADAGAVEIEPDGVVEPREIDAATVERAARLDERRRELERSRVDMIRAYAELRDCRRRFLLNYFGEPRDEPCGHCDACDAGLSAPAAGRRPFELEARVRHPKWGEGVVQRYEGDKLVVLFDEVGRKTLEVDLVVDRGLLEPL